MDHRHFFGDSVAGTLIRLVLLSIVVGIIFSALGINPSNIVEKLQLLVQRLTTLGFDTVKWAVGYFLLGAWWCSRSGSSCVDARHEAA